MSKSERERMADLTNNAISAVYEEHPEVKEKEIRRLFTYLTNYCKIVQHGEIPFSVYKSTQHCSIFYIRNRVNNFLEEYKSTYHKMKPVDIVKIMIGQKKYEETIQSLMDLSLSSSSSTLSSASSPRSLKGRLSDVDGGAARRKRHTKRHAKRTKKTRKAKF